MLHSRKFSCEILINPHDEIKTCLLKIFGLVEKNTNQLLKITIDPSSHYNLAKVKQLELIKTGMIPLAVVYSSVRYQNGKQIDLLDMYKDKNLNYLEKIVDSIDSTGKLITLKNNKIIPTKILRGLDPKINMNVLQVYSIPTNLYYENNGKIFNLCFLIDSRNWHFLYQEVAQEFINTLDNVNLFQ